MKAVTQHYIGTTEEWKTANPKLYKAVWGFEETKDGEVHAKLGNGKDPWNDLKYFDDKNIKGLPGKLQELRDIAERAVRIANNASPSYPVNLDTDSPTQEQLQAIYENVSGNTGEPDDLVLMEDLTYKKIYKYYISEHAWVDMGAIGISMFTDQSMGGILGSDEPGYVTSAGNGKGKVSGWNRKVDKVENHRLITPEEIEKLLLTHANPYGQTLPPGIVLEGFINDEFLPLFRMIKLEGQTIDISPESPYYMLGQIIYVGDENNDNPLLDGCYKINYLGERDINGTKMVLPAGQGMHTRGAGANPRHFPSTGTLYDGGELGTFLHAQVGRHAHGYNKVTVNEASYGWIGLTGTGTGQNLLTIGSSNTAEFGQDIENRVASLTVRKYITY